MKGEGPQGAFVCAVGLATAVGDSAAQTATSVRAGICRYALSEHHTRHFKAMKLAQIPEALLPPPPEPAPDEPRTPRQDRLLRLAGLALPQVLAALPERQTAPIFLAGPESLFGLTCPTTTALCTSIAGLGGDRIAAPVEPPIAEGRAAGLRALRRAMEHLQRNKGSHAIVGGVDSLIDPELLAAFDREDRVLAEGVLDGFVPGEGAGFLLLSDATARDRWHRTARVRVHAPGLADEPGHRFSQEAYLGEGLSRAVADALATDKGPFGTVLSTMNGESFGAKEWGTAAIRNAGSLGREWKMVHPADCFGDIGAAFGTVLVGLAAIGLENGSLGGPCLVYCSSEGAPRGAVRVTLGP